MKTKKTTSNSTMSEVKTQVKKTIENFVKRSALFFKNPKTGNLVCYQRAIQLGLLGDKTIECGIKNPKTNHLVRNVQRAQSMGLISKSDFKYAA